MLFGTVLHCTCLSFSFWNYSGLFRVGLAPCVGSVALRCTCRPRSACLAWQLEQYSRQSRAVTLFSSAAAASRLLPVASSPRRYCILDVYNFISLHHLILAFYPWQSTSLLSVHLRLHHCAVARASFSHTLGLINIRDTTTVDAPRLTLIANRHLAAITFLRTSGRPESAAF